MRQTRFLTVVAAWLLILGAFWAADPLPANDRVRAEVDGQVSKWWLKPEEKRFDQIAWAADIRTAQKLAAKNDRPVFLFTMKGRVNLGRC